MTLLTLNSCSTSPSTNNSAVQPQADTAKYKIGQYVYIHGEVKAIVKENHRGSNCGCSNNSQYKLVVAGVDGSSHIWYVNDDEISPNRDTIIHRVITDVDSSNIIIYKAVLESQSINNMILETDRQIKRQLEQRAKTQNEL